MHRSMNTATTLWAQAAQPVMHDVSNLLQQGANEWERSANLDGANRSTRDPLNAVLRVDNASHNVFGRL